MEEDVALPDVRARGPLSGAPVPIDRAAVLALPALPRWMQCPPPGALWLFAPAPPAAAAWALGSGAISAADAARDVLVGVLAWSLLEYVSHRFLLHAMPGSDRLRALNLHLRHHASPGDLAYQVIPFWVSLPILAVVVAVFRWGLGTWEHACLCTASALVGYLFYEYVHLHVHLPGGGRIVRALRRHHLHHHHVDATRSFGFTSPLWDVVFRTQRRKGAR